jgi:hypothetical protein
MSSPVHDETSQQADQQQAIAVDIDEYLRDGMSVLDVNGKPVGSVRMYSTAVGYLMVSTGTVEQTYLYIPFRLIRTIDPHEIVLSAAKEALAGQYTQPPKIDVVMETRMVPGPNGTMIPQARQVQMLQSGYDATPAELESINADDTAKRLAVGMVVYDVDGERLGNITQYDIDHGLMVVQKGIFKPTVVVVPVSDIDNFSVDNLSVYLALPKDLVVKKQTMRP